MFCSLKKWINAYSNKVRLHFNAIESFHISLSHNDITKQAIQI